jgi:hypothetical protein
MVLFTENKTIKIDFKHENLYEKESFKAVHCF